MMETALRLGVAALGGLAVGVEREWSSSRGERAPRFAGVRTFLLLGLIGGLAADLHARGATAAGALLLASGRALALGVIAACTVLYVRVAVLSSVLNPAVALAAGPYLAVPLAAGALVAGWIVRGGQPRTAEVPMPRNPLRLGAAIQMAVAFQIVLYAVAWASTRFGSSGVFLSAAVLGLTDVDALTYSMAKVGYGPPGPAVAARGLAVGILSNTLFKLALAGSLGRGPFRRLAIAGLAALAAAGLVMLLVY